MTTNDQIEVQLLAKSLNPLIDHFNTHHDKLRFLAIFSPMCPKWATQGARAVQTSILETFDHPDISVTIVWIRMLPNDSIETARTAARPFTDSRVCHFFDPNTQVGKDIANSLQWEGRIAWDIYLFYAPGHKWADLPPSPFLYSHQLTNEWADREHYRVGADLAASLRLSMGEMIRSYNDNHVSTTRKQ